MSVYVVDSNFFIQAHRLVYPLDVVPSFWNKIKSLAEQGTIHSIDKVKYEIISYKDPLTQWIIDNLDDSFFKDTTIVLNHYRQVTNWATSRNAHYTATALTEFLDADEADAWLVAHAYANNSTLITHEKSDPFNKKRIKIPEACNHFGLPFMNTIEMFRAIGEQF